MSFIDFQFEHFSLQTHKAETIMHFAVGRVSGIVLLAVMSAAAVGCGGTSGPELVPAQGTVKFQGGPMAGAQVSFVPEKGPVAFATTDTEGKFVLKTGTLPGVAIGPSRASVSMKDSGGGGPLDKPMTPEDMQKMAMEGTLDAAMAKQNKSLIPEKYGNIETSGLSFEVKKGEPNEFAIELQ